MMDQMDDVLIECDELQYGTGAAQRPTTSKAAAPAGTASASSSRSLPGVHRGGPDRQTSSSDGRGVTTAIMMYSPDIPSAEGKSAYDTKPNLANYYATIETEETIKCVVSTVLFLAIVVAITLVAFLENPQM